MRLILINPYAVNAEAIIETLRAQLQAAMPFDNYFAMPRAIPKQRKSINDKVAKFPSIDQYKSISGTYDNLSLEPCERRNFSFFVYDKESEDGDGNLILELGLIFYFDLRTIATSEYIKDKIKMDIKSILDNPNYRSFTVGNTEIIDNDFNSVWQGFNLPDLDMQYYQFPFYTLRMDFEVIGKMSCGVPAVYIKNNC